MKNFYSLSLKLLALLLILALTQSLTAWQAQNTNWETYIDAGNKERNEGHYNQAEKLYLLAVEEAQKLGQQDTRYAISLNNLGELYDTQGKYTQAEPLLKRALAIDEKALGSNHPDVARDLNNQVPFHLWLTPV